MTRNHSPNLAAVLVASSLGFASPALAQEQEQEEVTPKMSPRVEAILQTMSQHLAAAKGISLQARIRRDDPLQSGVLVERSARIEVVAGRPGSLHAVLHADGNHRRLWIHDKTATLFDGVAYVTTTSKVPGEIGAALDHLMEKHEVSLPLADLFVANPYEALTANLEGSAYVGRDEVDGVMCHHLVFTQEAIDWQLWVDDGAMVLPRRLVITYKLLNGSPRYAANITKLELRAVAPPVAAFSPIVPEDAEKLDLLEVKEQPAKK